MRDKKTEQVKTRETRGEGKRKTDRLYEYKCGKYTSSRFTPPGARPAARCSWTLGSWDGGREGRPGGSHPDVQLLPPSLWQLDAGGVGSAVDLWPVAMSPWDLTLFRIGDGGPPLPCSAGRGT